MIVSAMTIPKSNLRTYDPLPPSFPSSVVRTTSSDIDEHCANLGRWRMVYDQIGTGAFSGSFTLVSLSRVEIYREVTSQQLSQRGELGEDTFSIGLPWRSDGDLRCNGASIGNRKILTCFDWDVDMCTPKSFEIRGVIVGASLMESTLTELGVELPQSRRQGFLAIDAAEASLARLRALLALLQNGIEVPSWVGSTAGLALEDALLLEIVDLVPTAQPFGIERCVVTRKRLVDRACEIMLSQSDATFSIMELCRAVGASRRKLNYCFQHVLGCSPVSYGRAVRLNRVRRDLKRSDDPKLGVYDIATSHGFWHFSQFSLDYKRQFAELPSETLRRSRIGQRFSKRYKTASLRGSAAWQ
jgi:AraC family ethanolamine operon transcriptional activator